MNWIIVAAAAVLLAGLLTAEKKQHLTGKLLTKTPASLLFILAAALQPHPLPDYTTWVIVGLSFCLVGDVCLALPQRPAFLVGLVSFLVGHVMYVFGFAVLSPMRLWWSAGAWGVAAISIGVFFWLRPHLGKMLGPVIAYILIISVMLIGAIGVFRSGGLRPDGQWLVLVGALLFYLSDLFVARQRFVAPGFVNRAIGLPMYYAGQFLIAFSIGTIR
jgi:uncharacterized membrane protein YhhN